MIDRALADKAHKLLKKTPDMPGKELAAALKVQYADRARHLAAIGAQYAAIDTMPLTDRELLVIDCLAAEHLQLLSVGETRSPQGKRVSWRAGKASGWALSVVSKRLDSHRDGEDKYRPGRGTGLNFVHASGNGYLNLTPAGWAFALQRKGTVGVPGKSS